MKHYDVIIAGAGPAGLQCAWALSQSALSVLLLKKIRASGTRYVPEGLPGKT